MSLFDNEGLFGTAPWGASPPASSFKSYTQKASALNSFYETETIFTLTQWEPVKLQNVALRLLLLQCGSRAKWTPNLAWKL